MTQRHEQALTQGDFYFHTEIIKKPERIGKSLLGSARAGFFSRISEIQPCQLFPLLIILRNVDPLDFEDDRPGLVIAAGVYFHVPVQGLKAPGKFPGFFPVGNVIESLWRIHGQNNARIDPAGKVIGIIIVGQSTEAQPFDQTMHLACNVSQINR